MIKAFFTSVGWVLQMLYLAVRFIWDAHFHLIKNLILPRGIIFPTLKEDGKESIKRD